MKPQFDPAAIPAAETLASPQGARRSDRFSLAEMPPDALLDHTQAAAALGVRPGTLSVWRCTGRYALPYLKVGRLVRYRAGDLLAWLETRARLHSGE